MDRDEAAKILLQLAVYDEEKSRGLVHTRSYEIKMEQYRLAVEAKFPSHA